MRRLLPYLLPLLLMAACSKDTPSEVDPVSPVPTAIGLSDDAFTLPQSGGELSLTVTAPARPKLTDLPDWVRLTDGTFKDYRITFSLKVAANASDEAREALVLVTAAGVPSVSFSIHQEGPVVPEPGKDPSGWENAAAAARNMGTGWNLGNTLESHSGDVNHMWIEAWSDRSPSVYEKAWGQPVTTRALFHMFKEAGFHAIRIPVTWYPHMGTMTLRDTEHWDLLSGWDGYAIDPVWMARVREVVDYVIDEGMYCILNVHHDTGDASTTWLKADRQYYETYKERYCALWTQIATEFRDYDHKLLFESFNEMLDGKNTWNYSTSEAHGIINQYNADFVRTVRATGGNNAHRNLILNTYAASPLPQVLQDFVLPEDSAADHLLAEVHSYAPYQFAFDVQSGAKTEFDDWCAAEVRRQIQYIYDGLISRGIPCIIGEYGCTSARSEAEIAKQCACYIEAAARYGIPCFCWMLLSDGEDRAVPTWTMPALKDAILKAYLENRKP